MANLTAEQEALKTAVINARVSEVESLLAAGVSPDFVESNGMTLLGYAGQCEASGISGARQYYSGSDLEPIFKNFSDPYSQIATLILDRIPEEKRLAYIETTANSGEKADGWYRPVAKTIQEYTIPPEPGQTEAPKTATNKWRDGEMGVAGVVKNARSDLLEKQREKEIAEEARRAAEAARRAQSASEKTPQPAVEPQPQPQEPTKHPSIWERYAPTWLGGWSQEKVKKYDDAMKAVGKERAPNFWDRHAPTWLAGWDQERVVAYDASRNNQQKSDKTEVFKGVTVDELKEAGYSDEKIRQMQDMVRNKVQEHQANQGGAAALLGKHAEPVRLTMEDYQSIGLDRNDALKLSALARNDEGR